MRRLFLLLLVAIASPMWVLVRVCFGYKLLAILFVSNLIIGLLAYYLLERGIPEIPDWVRAQPAPPIVGVYVLSGLLWGIQIVFAILRRLAVLAEGAAVPHPWAAGGSPLSVRAKNSYDIATTIVVLVLVYYLINAPNSIFTDLDMVIAIVITTAFIITVYVARTNENTLPLLPLFPNARRSSKAIKPQLAALRPMPKPMRDDLAAIFSRRDPALQSIGGEKHSGHKSK